MTREEAIERFNGIINAMSISVAQSKFYPSKAELDELCDTAIEALNREQQIIENGYTGKEMRIRIGGKLFAVRELAQ